jgi:TrmH family RNA methyltransferase
MDCSVILVEPKYAGNTGAVARLMKNFDVFRLVVVNPAFSLEDDECRKYAVHAQNILDAARVVDTFDQAADAVDILAATTSIESRDDRRHLRKAILAETFARQMRQVKGRVGVVFGREDYGLFNEELGKCDLVVKIPTSDVYPCLNLAQSVGIVLYELYRQRRPVVDMFVETDGAEKRRLYEFFDALLNVSDYPVYKREKTSIMFRRIIGRSMLSAWEYHTIMGVFKRAVRRCERSNKEETRR